MVLVEIEGGLGNQMFQYAAGKALSMRLKEPLFLSNDVFKIFSADGSMQSYFPCASYSIASLLLKRSFIETSTNNKLKRIVGFGHKKTYQEKGILYNKKVESLTAPVYIKGFWQSEKYFHAYKDEIRNSFQFNANSCCVNKEIANAIQSCNAVSVHVRRGDYITNKENFKKHGVCDMNFFLGAFALIEEKIKSPSYFVFTDDAVWAKKELLPFRKDAVVVVGNNNCNSWMDMYLMSLCKHNIIANSTFSWWGAWLNNNKDKVIIAPEKWFALTHLNEQSADLIPVEWIKI